MTSFQLLSCRVEIQHDDPTLADKFAYLANRARQATAVRKTLRYRVHGHSPYEIREEGDLVCSVDTPDDALYIVYSRVHRRVLERFVLSGWVVFHGSLVEIGGRRVLLLGNKGAGKTTLAARLLYVGRRVEGDEFALERAGQVVAFPRLLHLKPGIERLVPELEPHLEGLPKTTLGSSRVAGFDPAKHGFDWEIRVRPVDEVVWISPNHGGATELMRLPPFDTIRHIVESSLGWGESREALVAAATRLGGAGGHRLTLGDPVEAVRCLESELAGLG